jgi:hypothetical protein
MWCIRATALSMANHSANRISFQAHDIGRRTQ